MIDETLVRLVMDIEEKDFVCKIGYDLVSRTNVDAWWFAKEKDVSEWLEQAGLEDIRLPACSCLMRMLVPMKAHIAKMPKRELLAPVERVEQVVATTDVRWVYEVRHQKGGNLTIEATNGDQAVTIVYQSVVKASEKLVTVHAQMRMRDKYTTISSAFSYKSDVKMHHINPWIHAQQALHAQMAEASGIPGEPVATSFAKAMLLVREGMSKGLAETHAKKSRKKDDEDGSLFEMES